MDNFIAFTEVTAAILAAMGLAMCLQWLTLNAVLRLLPSRLEQKANSLQKHRPA